MKNPQFGVWAKDDEEVSDAQMGEPVDERVAQALALVEEMKTKTALSLYEDEDNDKWLRQHIAINNRPAPLPLPSENIYSRPLTKREAEMLLKSAEIVFSIIKNTYIADYGYFLDRDTARPICHRTQCVVAELPAEMVCSDGRAVKTTANVHLLFVWEKERGWKLVKAMVEKES